jgi:hypothetical protein
MNQPRRYPEWRSDSKGRWRDVFHTFGYLLMTHARDEALNRIPADTSVDTPLLGGWGLPGVSSQLAAPQPQARRQVVRSTSAQSTGDLCT